MKKNEIVFRSMRDGNEFGRGDGIVKMTNEIKTMVTV